MHSGAERVTPLNHRGILGVHAFHLGCRLVKLGLSVPEKGKKLQMTHRKKIKALAFD